MTLSGNTRPEANALNYRGPVSADLPIDHMLLFLQRSPEQEQAVDQFINSLNDRNSPNFHKWLTPEEFGERFGVDESDIQQVTNWLQSQGFQINQVYPNRMVIDFSGTAGQIAQAFRTQIAQPRGWRRGAHRQYERSADSGGAGAGDQGLCLPERLPAARANHVSAAQYTFAGCASSTAHPTEPGTCYAMTPQDNADHLQPESALERRDTPGRVRPSLWSRTPTLMAAQPTGTPTARPSG